MKINKIKLFLVGLLAIVAFPLLSSVGYAKSHKPSASIKIVGKNKVSDTILFFNQGQGLNNFDYTPPLNTKKEKSISITLKPKQKLKDFPFSVGISNANDDASKTYGVCMFNATITYNGTTSTLSNVTLQQTGGDSGGKNITCKLKKKDGNSYQILFSQ